MTSKILFFTAIICLLVAASCAPNATTAGSLPAAEAPGTTKTVLPIPSTTSTSPGLATTSTPEPSTPGSSSTPPPQPQPTQPSQIQPNCSDSASFEADVTIPDNTTINKGATFLKTWRIRNTGTCTWNESYNMVFVNGDQMNSIASIPFKVTSPGDSLDLSVNLVAPSVDGTYTGNYELRNAAGDPFLIDSTRTIWVKITIGTGTTQRPDAPAASNAGTGTPTNGTAGTCSYFEDSALENDLVSQINAARAAYGLPALARNAKLSAAALSHSVDMACHSSISHTGSDGSTITGRMAAYGYHYSYWNEAIYAQPPEYGGNAQAAIDWWLNDPPHRVILLSPDAKDIGSGYVYVAGSKLGGYFTIDVASPAP